MIGRTVSHYKIIEKLGEGGMGEVYLADDTKLKRQVAIKFLPSRITINKTDKARFLQEAQAAAAINHPNVCVIYDIKEHDDQQFIVMEYVEGQTLSDKIASKPLPIKEVVEYAIQIGTALQAAHEKGIVHRDIKSDNIMIRKTEQIKVMDFGLAKLRGSAKLTRTTSTVGTLAYMSPEQIEGREIDGRADIYSFGVVLYEMLTGRRPFQGEYESALMYSILNEDPEPIQKLRPDITSELLHVVNRALEKDAADRFQSINELIIDLRRLKRDSSKVSRHNVPVTSNLSSTEQNTTELISKNKSTNFFNTKNIAIGLVIILILVILYIYFPNLEKRKVTIPVKHSQITFTGDAYNPAMSPDGSLVAYITDRDSAEQKVLVQDIKGGKPLVIFKGKLQVWRSIRWSPDGSKLSIPATKDSITKIYIIPRLGGDDRRLEFYDYYTWSPDGKKIAGANFSSNRIWFSDVESGDTSSIKIKIDINSFRSIDWSPDGSHLLFLAITKATTTIWIIKTDGSGQKKFLEGLYIVSPRWAADGKAIYYLILINNTFDLQKINVNPMVAKVIGSPINLQSGLNLDINAGISISADDKKLMTTKHAGHSNLYAFQKTDHGYSVNPLTSGTSNVLISSISPDGKNIVFSMSDFQKSNIYVMPSSGGTHKQLTFNQEWNSNPVWSTDGSEIAYYSISEQDKEVKVWRMNNLGGTPKPVQIKNLNQNLSLNWAPGKDILYQGADKRTFYFHNPETGKERSLVESDSSIYIWFQCYSPDLKKIAVSWTPSEQVKKKSGLWIISLVDSTKTQISDKRLEPIVWSSDGNWIYFCDYENPSKIRMINVKNGEEQPFYTLPFSGVNPYFISMTPDARLITAIVEKKQTDILMLENFDPEVE